MTAPIAARAAPRPRRLLATLLACALAVPGGAVAPARAQAPSPSPGTFSPLSPPPAQPSLPALGDSDSAGFPINAERRLGDEIMREIRVDPDYLDDPLLLEYLESIWQPLLLKARQLGNITPDIDARFAWEPFLVRDPSVNAFALPGGYVGVHLGLIALTTSRDELASVIGHEMSHVTQRHIARSITANSRRSLVSLAALIVGLIAASRSSNPDAINAVVTGSQAAAIQGQLNFSRDVEREADRIGFQVMTAAGFAPGGMASMFEKMDLSQRLNDYGGFPYLRSHPLTAERIGEAQARAGIATTAPRVSVLEHTAAQARARVLMDSRSDALHRWEGRDADNEGAPADRFRAALEGALAASQLRNWARADAAFAKAMGIARGSPASSDRALRAVALMQAQSYLDRGAVQPALAAARPWAQDGSRPVLLLEARAAIVGAREVDPDNPALKAEASDLQTWVALHPNDALAWSALGQAWGKLGVPLRSLRAEAESRYALGDLVGAIDRLRAAQRAVRNAPADFIDASVVDSRLRVIAGERQQLEIDRRAGR